MQGSMTSPFLFDIYMEEMLRKWKNKLRRRYGGDKTRLNERYFNDKMYADDMSYFIHVDYTATSI